jgi:hypothetical protein
MKVQLFSTYDMNRHGMAADLCHFVLSPAPATLPSEKSRITNKFKGDTGGGQKSRFNCNTAGL